MDDVVPMSESEMADFRRYLADPENNSCESHSDESMRRVFATFDQRVSEIEAERDGLYDALDLATREHDQKLRELASATGVAWEGKSHEEVVELVKALRPRTREEPER